MARNESAGEIIMKFGTAKPGMRVRIVGCCNAHGIPIGRIVTLSERGPNAYSENSGNCFVVRTNVAGYSWVVREIDMAPVEAKVV